MKKFEELGLSENTIKAISNMGFEETTPIQEQTIPLVLSGRDVIGQAQTGTGKTAAFGIPLIERADAISGKIQGIVLAPTRELAVQVAEELNKIGQFKDIHTLPIYGGQEIIRQIKALKNKPHIIVGTPGRLLDHIRRKTIKLDSIEMVILDEADEMLNMGFVEDIESILSEIPTSRQTLLFSATIPERIQRLSQKYMNNPELIRVKTKEVTVSNTEQHYMEVKERQKFDVLCLMLDIQSPELAIVFGRTKRRVDEVSEALSKRGYSAEGIHGDLTQSKRDSVMKKFKEGTIEVLVATDVAARGLDISGVTHVFNFDIPQDSESYVHRIGRTGRAGKSGLAITFITSREIGHLKAIEGAIRRKIERQNVPTTYDALEGQKKIATQKLIGIIEDGKYNKYKGMAEELLQEYDSVTLVASALKMLIKEPDFTPIQLTSESPLRVKDDRKRFDKKKDFRENSNTNKSRSRNKFQQDRKFKKQ
ncbi:MAG: DEAD/DEAH box helicase [Vulcanibacillus sp.]